MKIDTENYDLYEKLSELFRFKTVSLLKNILANTSLSDDEKKAICGEFLAEFCVNLDQGEWALESDYFRPVLSFIGGENLQIWNENTNLFLPYEAYHHHDKAWEEIDEHYENA